MLAATVALKHPSLAHPPSNFIGGDWIALPPAPSAAGAKAAASSKPVVGAVESRNPAHPDRIVWSGQTSLDAVEEAVAAAQQALPAWALWGRDNRFRVLRRFAELCKQHAAKIADLICDETGKAMWEARGEASALASKVDITLDTSPHGGLSRVNGFEFEMGPGKLARCTFKPHGVMAVLGPFNFPAHLPNGHIVPALAMGNTVVFKPSDKTPGVGQLLTELFAEALRLENAPDGGAGIINLVQGGADVASALTSHDGINGILFTGSWPVGRRILEANLDNPGRIVALELGGNNPVVVMHDADLKQAAIEIVRCAFNTTGQRCTCTRRVIAHERIADRLFSAIVEASKRLNFAEPRGQGVFAGPTINEQSRQAALDFQDRAAKAGAELLLESKQLHPQGAKDGFFLSPSIIRVDEFVDAPWDPKGKAKFHPGADHEVFGPLLRVCTAKDLDDALDLSNATRYGLAASIFTKDNAAAERFMFEMNSGCININAGTAGASSKLPFGGVGLSGNHRPAGSFSLDYCAYPVAGMIERGESAQIAEGMKWEDAWVR